MARKKQEPTKVKSLYAVPCSDQERSIFFITFNTRNEKEALALASCVHGNKGKRALVIIGEDGSIYQL